MATPSTALANSPPPETAALTLRLDALSAELRRDVLYLVQSPVPAIIDEQSLRAANLIRAKALETEKAIKARYADDKKKKWDEHKAVCAEEGAFLTAVTDVDKKIQTAISVFNKAEDERRLLEEQRQAEDRRQAEQTRLIAESATLESQGDTAMAAAVLEQAIATPMPVVVLPNRVKAAGTKLRRDWKWRPTGGDTPVGLARAMELVPRDYLCLDAKKLDGYASTMKETAKIPGLEFYYEDVPVR